MKKEPPPLLLQRRMDFESLEKSYVTDLKLTEKAMLKKLEENPENDHIRRVLLDRLFYKSLQNKLPNLEHFEHLRWFIENNPRASFLSDYTLFPECSPQSISAVKDLWLKAMDKAEQAGLNDRLVELNAAHMLFLVDKHWSREILKKCYLLEPECEDWPLELSAYYLYDESEWGECIEYARQAIALHEKYPRRSYLDSSFKMHVGEWMELALKTNNLDACREFARALLARQNSFPRQWKSGEAVLWHDLQGRIALREEDMTLCQKHLFGTLDFLEPETEFKVDLVSDLLESRANQLVLDYLLKLKERVEALYPNYPSLYAVDSLIAKLKALKPGSKRRIKGALQLELFS